MIYLNLVADSQLFYSNMVGSVDSVEYDKFWFDKLKPDLPQNVKLHYKEKSVDGEYCRVIQSSESLYDIVVVDGRDRVNCIKQSIGMLKAGGVVLLDDSQRERYIDGINYARSEGFRTLDFEGLKSTGLTLDRTTILYRDNNCLGL
jgi:hypothetical protein